MYFWVGKFALRKETSCDYQRKCPILGLKVNPKHVKFDFMPMLMVFESYYALGGGSVCYFRKRTRKFCEETSHSSHAKSISFLTGVPLPSEGFFHCGAQS